MTDLLLATLAALLLVAPGTSRADPPWHPFPSAPAATAVTRIYNGTPTTAYPAVAKIVVATPQGLALCSGSLVAPTVVLTAAHCVLGSLGATVVFFPEGTTEDDFPAVSYVVHPDYSPSVLATADVAVVQLATPVTGVTPLALPAAAPKPRRRGVIVGYGQDQDGTVGTKEVGNVRLRKCPRAFLAAGVKRGELATSLCWKPTRRGQDTCPGDSGGPLLVDGAVAGITSGGFPGCPGRLSWDTNVATFVPWISTFLH